MCFANSFFSQWMLDQNFIQNAGRLEGWQSA
jgi:hypothetical protein